MSPLLLSHSLEDMSGNYPRPVPDREVNRKAQDNLAWQYSLAIVAIVLLMELVLFVMNVGMAIFVTVFQLIILGLYERKCNVYKII